MKINLYYPFYNEKKDVRKAELELCYRMNCKAGFDAIYVFGEQKDEEYLIGLIRMTERKSDMGAIITDTRVKFSDFFDYANAIADTETTIHICCNSDIFFTPKALDQIRNIPWHPKLALCLSRWDVVSFNHEGEVMQSAHLDRQDSQDVWITFGKHSFIGGDFMQGSVGQDNRLIHEFRASGYTVFNPSKDLKTYHYHKVPINNYRVDGDPNKAVYSNMIVPEPYGFIAPGHLKDIK